MRTDQIPLERRQNAVPAWGMSVGLHVALLLAIALVMPRVRPAQGLQEESRPAAIVLVQNSPDAPSQYFSEEDALHPADVLADQRPATPAVTGADSAAANDSADALDPLNELLPAAPAAVAAVPADLGRPLSEFRSAGRNIGPSAAQADAEAKAIAAEQERMRVPSPTGPTASISVFGSAPAEGRTFTFVLDRSASMGSEGLGVLGPAAEQLQAAIQSLSSTHKFQIIAYNQRPLPLGPKSMTPATDENKELVRKFFLTLGPFGSTDHELALVGALAAKPDVVFLMTDGGDPFLAPAQFKRLRDMAKGRTTIHCIQFGKGPPVDDGERFMRELAEQTGGSFTYVDVNR